MSETVNILAGARWQNLGRYWQWTQKLSGAVLDQGLYAGSNFILNVLLARWLPVEEYGAFVVAYSWLALAQSFYEAVIIEPLTIFGAGKYANHFKTYLGYTAYLHIAVTLVMGLALGLGALVSLVQGSSVIAAAMLGAAMAAPLFLVRQLTRYPFYVLSQPGWSAFGGGVYMLMILAGIAGLHTIEQLSPLSALLVMAFSSLGVSVLMTVFVLHPRWRSTNGEITLREVANDHWTYGRWSAGARMLGWIPSNAMYIIAPLLLGLSGSAALRAILNIVLPIMMAMSAITNLVLPTLVRTFAREGKRGVDRKVRRFTQGFVAAGMVYCLVLVVLGRLLIHHMYDGRFDAFINLPILFAIAVLPMIQATCMLLDAALRAVGEVKLTFFSKMLPALVTISLGVVATALFGLLGANVAVLLSNLASMGVLIYFYRRHITAPASRPTDKAEGSP